MSQKKFNYLKILYFIEKFQTTSIYLLIKQTYRVRNQVICFRINEELGPAIFLPFQIFKWVRLKSLFWYQIITHNLKYLIQCQKFTKYNCLLHTTISQKETSSSKWTWENCIRNSLLVLLKQPCIDSEYAFFLARSQKLRP